MPPQSPRTNGQLCHFSCSLSGDLVEQVDLRIHQFCTDEESEGVMNESGSSMHHYSGLQASGPSALTAEKAERVDSLFEFQLMFT